MYTADINDYLVGRVWAKMAVHMLKSIIQRICNIDRNEIFDSSMEDSAYLKYFRISHLYNTAYETFKMKKMAIKFIKSHEDADATSIFCTIFADAKCECVKMNFNFLGDITTKHHFEAFFDRLQACISVVLDKYFTRIGGYYILDPLKDLKFFTHEVAPNIYENGLLKTEISNIIKKVNSYRYMVNEHRLENMAQYLRSWDSSIDLLTHRSKIQEFLGKLIINIVIDIFTKVFALQIKSEHKVSF